MASIVKPRRGAAARPRVTAARGFPPATPSSCWSTRRRLSDPAVLVERLLGADMDCAPRRRARSLALPVFDAASWGGAQRGRVRPTTPLRHARGRALRRSAETGATSSLFWPPGCSAPGTLLRHYRLAPPFRRDRARPSSPPPHVMDPCGVDRQRRAMLREQPAPPRIVVPTPSQASRDRPSRRGTAGREAAPGFDTWHPPHRHHLAALGNSAGSRARAGRSARRAQGAGRAVSPTPRDGGARSLARLRIRSTFWRTRPRDRSTPLQAGDLSCPTAS